MNYRHGFHAGNFADLLKHAVLLELLRAGIAAADRASITVVDTHAGAGLHDLEGPLARRTGEGAAVAVLMTDRSAPRTFAPLIGAIRRANPSGGQRFYPGSPVLITGASRPGDRLIAIEAREDDARDLARAIGTERVRRGDGWTLGPRAMPPPPAAVLVLVDPPWEAAGEAERAAAFLAAALRRHGSAVVALWAPIKDLASLEALRERLACAAPRVFIEARLRRLGDPLRLNGCALVVVNPPAGLAEAGRAAADWVVARLGEAGGEARVEAG